MEGKPLGITLSGVGKRYGRQWVLRDVDLDIPPGSTWAILGANGSGKSSLLRMLCALDRNSSGTMHWHVGGDPVDPMEVPLAIAYCAPDQALIPDLTVAEHIALHRQLRNGTSPDRGEEVIRWALLEGKGHVRVRDLSSGMRQRLALTLAFTTPCGALFLDEPTSHLDREGKSWYADLVSEHRAGRTLVVASNHDPADHPGVLSTWEVPSI